MSREVLKLRKATLFVRCGFFYGGCRDRACPVSTIKWGRRGGFWGRLSERDSSGTTERQAKRSREGDGADSPTRARRRREAARPNNLKSL
jgi:hypothetical protein